MKDIYVSYGQIQNVRAFVSGSNLIQEIARSFNISKSPDVIFDISDNENDRIPVFTENSKNLKKGRHYLWIEAADTLPNKTMIQNALFCSMAIYCENPAEYLQFNKKFHSVSRYLFAINKTDEQLIVVIAEKKVQNTTKKTLIIAFRSVNLDLSNSVDEKEVYTISCKTESYESQITAILLLAEINRVDEILTCGHLMGGALASLIHFRISHILRVDSKNHNYQISNITFNTPIINKRNKCDCQTFTSEMSSNVIQISIASNLRNYAKILQCLQEQYYSEKTSQAQDHSIASENSSQNEEDKFVPIGFFLKLPIESLDESSTIRKTPRFQRWTGNKFRNKDVPLGLQNLHDSLKSFFAGFASFPNSQIANDSFDRLLKQQEENFSVSKSIPNYKSPIANLPNSAGFFKINSNYMGRA